MGGMAEDPGLLQEHANRSAEAGDYAAALALRERAFASLRARGDLRRAAYVAAYQIAFDHLALFGNKAVAQGWLERAGHLVAEAGECAEAGWVALSRALYTADPAVRAELVAEGDQTRAAIRGYRPSVRRPRLHRSRAGRGRQGHRRHAPSRRGGRSCPERRGRKPGGDR